MKNILLLSLISLLIISCGSQTQEKTVQFEMTRMPSNPLDGLEGYFFEVETPYPIDNSDIIAFSKKKHQEELDNYPQKVKEAERLHQEALEEYEKDLEIARENFKIESEEYNKLSTFERLARDHKPTLKEPRKPKYYKPREPVYREPNLSRTIIFNPIVLADTYLRVEGSQKLNKEKNVLKGEVKFYDFETMDAETIVEEQNVYNTKSKKTEKQRVYSYVNIYKRPVYLKLTYNGKALHDGIFSNTGEFVRDTNSNKLNMFNVEKQTIEDLLVDINNYVNSMYGYTKIQINTSLRYIENEEGKYNDIDKATNNALKAYRTFDSFSDNKNLTSAIEIWEKALSESDLVNDEARINEEVTIALLFNLLEANLYLGNPDMAKKHSSHLKQLDLGYSDEQNLRELDKMIDDFSARY
ncbi:MAG: hypothetical protein ACE364_07210 [Chlorobiota bacterium]